MESHRYFINLSYLGKNYYGWQIQPRHSSVQQTIEDALSVIMKEKVSLTGAGRTDTGVSALDYTAHFDASLTDKEMLKLNLVYKLNRILSHDIAIKNIRKVKNDAHARFSAVSRSYTYYICTEKDPLWYERSWIMQRPLNLEKITEATELLLTYSDFESFSKSNTQVNNYNCRIMEAAWEKEGHLFIFRIRADRFLRNMVRAMVGTLVDVGLEKISPAQFGEIIESKNRSRAGYSVPGHGLYFMGAEYNENIFL